MSVCAFHVAVERASVVCVDDEISAVVDDRALNDVVRVEVDRATEHAMDAVVLVRGHEVDDGRVAGSGDDCVVHGDFSVGMSVADAHRCSGLGTGAAT